jgi:hypothetical protein
MPIPERNASFRSETPLAVGQPLDSATPWNSLGSLDVLLPPCIRARTLYCPIFYSELYAEQRLNTFAPLL